MKRTRTLLSEDYMGTENAAKLLIKFGLPAIATILINSLYNMVDRIFVSNGVGYIALSAISLTSPITSIMQALAVLIGMGGHTIFAMKLGEKNRNEAERVLGNTLTAIFAISLLKFAVLYTLLEPILILLGAEGETLQYALGYMRIILFGTFFSAVSNGMNNFVNTSGNPTMGMLCLLTGCVMNLVLDPLFIFVFHWGVEGAAIATIIAQCASACMVMGYFARSKRSPVRLRLSQLRLDMRLTLQSMKLGTASALSSATYSLVAAFTNRSIVYYGAMGGPISGDIALSAISATTSTGMVFVIPANGLQQAVQSLCGYNFGAKNYARVKEFVKKGLIMSVLVSIPGYVILHLFTGFFISLYGNTDNTAFVEYAKWTMHIYNITVPVQALHAICTGYFLSSGQALKATAVSLVRSVFGLVPLTIILPLFMGVDGCIWAVPGADVIGAAVALVMLYFDMRRLNGLIADREHGGPMLRTQTVEQI